MEPEYPLFVYGTLCDRGMRKDVVLVDFEIGQIRDRNYPGIRPCAGKVVYGQLREQPDLRTLDLFEGVSRGLYRRVLVRVNTSKGGNVLAWAYEFLQDALLGFDPIASGEWTSKWEG